MSDAEPRSLEGTKDVPVGPRIQLSKNGPMTDMPGATPGAPARRKHHRKKDAESGTAKPLSPLRQDATGTVSEATASASDDAPSSSSACSSTDGTPLLVTVPDGVTPVAPDAKTPTLAQLPKDIAAVRSSTALPVSRTPDTASGAPLPKAQQSASMVCRFLHPLFFFSCASLLGVWGGSFACFFSFLFCMFVASGRKDEWCLPLQVAPLLCARVLA